MACEVGPTNEAKEEGNDGIAHIFDSASIIIEMMEAEVSIKSGVDRSINRESRDQG